MKIAHPKNVSEGKHILGIIQSVGSGREHHGSFGVYWGVSGSIREYLGRVRPRAIAAYSSLTNPGGWMGPRD